ncbi:low molecular weight phosphatase family protein [Cerasicoccus maritimus]|uniref:arsenate-mycothiol transferase ArsC n=1 Tax=Cerasicoccus maritimus TaxID=490089 RepID=UPI002852B4C6|nr:low molecular weight phosphatase family protein [Cerasicoccus maritimus]
MKPLEHESRRVLFICTGNYYRSRFAEGLFNHLASERNLPWWAYSRGLNINWIIDNSQISPFTAQALRERNIDFSHTGSRRMPLSGIDLRSADRIVALKRDEHYPMLVHQFPGWEKRVEYWTVHDVDLATPEMALAEIEGHVRHLLDELVAPG